MFSLESIPNEFEVPNSRYKDPWNFPCICSRSCVILEVYLIWETFILSRATFVTILKPYARTMLIVNLTIVITMREFTVYLPCRVYEIYCLGKHIL
jgi:hypothetical protein